VARSLARLTEADSYWLVTIHPTGRPHVRPVLAVVVGATPHVVMNLATRKAGNLAREPRCALTAPTEGLDLVIEGTAHHITDDPALEQVAGVYNSKYDWPVHPRDGALHGADGAPTAGPPPYQVYRITPRRAFGFGTTETLGPRSTRWRF
jgi:hypothetical protein